MARSVGHGASGANGGWAARLGATGDNGGLTARAGASGASRRSGAIGGIGAGGVG